MRPAVVFVLGLLGILVIYAIINLLVGGKKIKSELGEIIELTNSNPLYSEPVYITNDGDTPILARIKFREYMELDGKTFVDGSKKKDVSTWLTHHTSDGDEFHDLVLWSQDAQVGDLPIATIYHMDEWISNGVPIGDFWVFDDNGWAYWARRVMPGDSTGALLESVQVVTDADFYYTLLIEKQTFSAEGEYEQFGLTKNGGWTADAQNLCNYVAASSEEDAYIGAEDEEMDHFDILDGSGITIIEVPTPTPTDENGSGEHDEENGASMFQAINTPPVPTPRYDAPTPTSAAVENTPTPTFTLIPTSTFTLIPTSTFTPTLTPTDTPRPTRTPRPTYTFTPAPEQPLTSTEDIQNTFTPTTTPTNTPRPASSTARPTATQASYARPTNVFVSNINSTMSYVFWTPTDGALYYLVEISTNGGSIYKTADIIKFADGASYLALDTSDGQLIASINTIKDVEYYVRILAVYSAGSAYSSPVTFRY